MNSYGYTDSDSNPVPVTITGTSGNWTHVRFVMGDICNRRHRWKLLSLRGSNRNQRVETAECVDCGRLERRVWRGPWSTPRPDKIIALRHAYGDENHA